MNIPTFDDPERLGSVFNVISSVRVRESPGGDRSTVSSQSPG